MDKLNPYLYFKSQSKHHFFGKPVVAHPWVISIHSSLRQLYTAYTPTVISLGVYMGPPDEAAHTP